MFSIKTLLVASLLFVTHAYADVGITDAWVRASAPGQKVGAAYMTLTSKEASTMVYAETARASAVEMHSMTMNDGVMKMRKLDELPLKVNKPAKLAPGGLHLMLFDLDKPLKAGERVAFKLCFKDAEGHITHQKVMLMVKSQY